MKIGWLRTNNIEWNLAQEYKQQNIKVQCYLIRADRFLKNKFGKNTKSQLVLANYHLDFIKEMLA